MPLPCSTHPLIQAWERSACLRKSSTMMEKLKLRHPSYLHCKYPSPFPLFLLPAKEINNLLHLLFNCHPLIHTTPFKDQTIKMDYSFSALAVMAFSSLAAAQIPAAEPHVSRMSSHQLQPAEPPISSANANLRPCPRFKELPLLEFSLLVELMLLVRYPLRSSITRGEC